MPSDNNDSLHSKLLNSKVSCAEIFLSPNIPDKKLKKAIKTYGQGINSSDIIALLDDTLFGSASEGILLTENHILFHSLMSDPVIIEFSKIKSININEKKIIINNNKEFSSCIALEKISKLYEVLKNHIECNDFDDISDNSNIDGDNKVIEENEIESEDGDIVPVENNSNESDDNSTVSNKFFGIIAKLDGYSIIIVSFLRNNAPDRVLSVISRLPVVGFLGFAGRIVLAPALKWLNDQIMKHGESYIMENLIDNFKKRNLTNEILLEKIEKAPKSIIGEDIIDDSIELLNKYMPSENIAIEENVEVNKDDVEDDKLICPACGYNNKIGAKFCSECGEKLIIEYKCNNCGYVQSTPIKFCPECGEKFITT